MGRSVILFLLCTVFSEIAFAQIQHISEWRFGINAGVSFATGSPVDVNTCYLNTPEGSASISDLNGNLLFYTDGYYVFDRQDLMMPNGWSLTGSGIAAQNTLIVPAPGNANQYYLFCMSNWTDASTELRYSVVDMTLNNGYGDITATKNVWVNSNTREQLTATYAANGIDIWIMIHETNNQNFCAYLLTPSGLSSSPVVSTVGMNYDGSNRFGSLRFSHNCSKLVSVLGGQPLVSTETVQLFDFDNSTGIVSNPLTLGTFTTIPFAYSAEFSPDDSKLYVVNFNTSAVYQFNLQASNILSSITNVSTTGSTCSWVQLAPDGKIYVAMAYTNYLSVINFPDSTGAACGFSSFAFSMSGDCGLCLPNFMNMSCQSSSAAPIVNFASADTILCEKSCIDFFDLSTNNPTQWQWNFTGAVPDTSTLQNPSGICFNTYGTYTVTLTATNANGQGTATKVAFITVVQSPPNPVITISNDTLYCSPAISYQWYYNNSLIPGATMNYYVANQAGDYFVMITDTNGCESASGLVTTALNDYSNQNSPVVVYQNGSGELLLHFSDVNTGSQILIYDVAGRLLFDKNMNGNNVKLDANLLPGIYFIAISNSKNRVKSNFKFMFSGIGRN